MNLLPHRWLFSPLSTVLFAGTLHAQVRLQSVQLAPGVSGPQVEISTSGPVVPAIQQLNNPPRLVIDLPNTRVQGKPQRIVVNRGAIQSIRVDELQDSPPIARVVVDMASFVPYSSQADGKRLVVNFGSAAATNSPDGKAASANAAQAPSQPMTFSGSPVMAGSSVTAGSDTAILHLAHGGEVRVCPGTTVSVTPSLNGRDTIVGMNTGVLEAHYALQSSSDSVLTPDFRILLSGPGQFDIAIGVDAHGNTCVRALPGNAASVIVSELMGDQTYQVKSSEQVLFHAGHIDNVDNKVPPTCGCPVPVTPIAIAQPESKPLPPSKPDDIHVTVDAPFVFSASQAAPAPNVTAQGPTILETESLPIQSGRSHTSLYLSLPDEVIPPTPVATKPAVRAPATTGFFGKIKKFFGSIFR